jgi:4-amino-4-deoxy-L-arabinose transferase-like glycosyltransferase
MRFSLPHPLTFMSLFTVSHVRACALLTLISLACFLPGFVSLQPMDRDEPRFAQASKQMIETGDYIDIRFQTEARHKKPVGIYWAQTSVVRMADALGIPDAKRQIWLYRIPSLLGALLAVLATYAAALSVLERRGALIAALMMATCVLLGVEARLAKTDALLLACTTFVMGVLLHIFLNRDYRPSWMVLGAFWSVVAIAVLIKGPIVFLIAGLAVLVLSVLERSGRWLLPLKPFYGLLFMLLLISPWFIAIAYKSGGDFFVASVGKDMLAKVGSGQEKHGAPPGFYLISFFATFWPSSLVIAMAAPVAWVKRREKFVMFALAWIVPSWLLFEAVPTKLPHYVLPLYPMIAILSVWLMSQDKVQLYRWGTRVFSAFIWIIPLFGIVGLSAFSARYDQILPVMGYPFVALALALAFFAWLNVLKLKPQEGLILACFAAIPFAIGVYGFSLPDVRSLQLSPRLAHAVERVGCQNPQVMTVGYREPSLVFLVGTSIEMGSAAETATFLEKGGCRIALVSAKDEEVFKSTGVQRQTNVSLHERISGFNINGGRAVEMGVYSVQTPQKPLEQ